MKLPDQTEACSVDVETEGALWERLFGHPDAGDGNPNVGVRPTALAVWHRRPVLQRADRIVLLKGGTVEATGQLRDLPTKSDEMERLWMGEPAPRS
jgi:ABC-type multidrug transport system fused ATPase/permease subunit